MEQYFENIVENGWKIQFPQFCSIQGNVPGNVWKCFPWYRNIAEILWKHSGIKISRHTVEEIQFFQCEPEEKVAKVFVIAVVFVLLLLLLVGRLQYPVSRQRVNTRMNHCTIMFGVLIGFMLFVIYLRFLLYFAFSSVFPPNLLKQRCYLFFLS